MKIEVLGSGCAKCGKLYEHAVEALKLSGKAGEVVKVDDIGKIVSYGVLATPALAIDGVVIISGKLATPEEINKLL